MNVRQHLANGLPLLFDGAMGTLYRGPQPCEQANIDAPQQIADIHRRYLQAGAQAIKTNTFGLSALLAAGQDNAQPLLEAACRIALKNAGPYGAAVFGDIGPAPQGGVVDAGMCYLRQAQAFLACGVTHFLVETLSADDGIAELAAFLLDKADYLIVSYAVSPEGVTQDGVSGAELYRRTRALPGVDAVGFNCVSGPNHLRAYVQGLPLSGTVSVMPNAGYPTVLGRRTVFMGTPDYFAREMLRVAQAGVRILGGCCGTTPSHIEETAKMLTTLDFSASAPVAKAERHRRAPERNRLSEQLDSGKRVIAVELDPPADDDIADFMDGARALRDAGADAITIADCPIGRPRADSSLLACKLKRELRMEPLPHLTCRDRNSNATKALLLGLSMEGVHNVLLVTGDPIPTAERDEVQTVYHFNSRKLSQYVSRLNEEVFTTPFRIFGALNLNAANFAAQLSIARQKEAAGVTAFLTQPVLSREAFDNLILARQTLHGKILGGIYPVVSHRNACFLNNEISGMRVCEEIIALYENKTREESEALAVRICTEVARLIAPHVDGYYLMTPFKRVSLMTRILANIQEDL